MTIGKVHKTNLGVSSQSMKQTSPYIKMFIFNHHRDIKWLDLEIITGLFGQTGYCGGYFNV